MIIGGTASGICLLCMGSILLLSTMADNGSDIVAARTTRPTSTPKPTNTPRPSQTQAPTTTPKPTNTPKPSNTPLPTDIPVTCTMKDNMIWHSVAPWLVDRIAEDLQLWDKGYSYYDLYQRADSWWKIATNTRFTPCVSDAAEPLKDYIFQYREFAYAMYEGDAPNAESSLSIARSFKEDFDFNYATLSIVNGWEDEIINTWNGVNVGACDIDTPLVNVVDLQETWLLDLSSFLVIKTEWEEVELVTVWLRNSPKCKNAGEIMQIYPRKSEN
jgi:hypothetical protein